MLMGHFSGSTVANLGVHVAAKITWTDKVTPLRITKSFLRTQPRSHICIFVVVVVVFAALSLLV